MNMRSKTLADTLRITDSDSLCVRPSLSHCYSLYLNFPICKMVLSLLCKVHGNLDMKASEHCSPKPHLSHYSQVFTSSTCSYYASSPPMTLKTKLGQGFILQLTYCN